MPRLARAVAAAAAGAVRTLRARCPMGWWKINSPSRGGIDRAHATGSKLLNAVPGRHTPENHYNGDGPADAMGNAVDRVLRAMGVAPPGPVEAVAGVSREELIELFLRREVPARFAK